VIEAVCKSNSHVLAPSGPSSTISKP
jgi:hypothetical protein